MSIDAAAATALPVADRPAVRRAVRELVAGDPRAALLVPVLAFAAAGAAAVPPWLVGRLVDDVSTGATSTVDLIAGLILVATVGQILLSRYARRSATRLGERAGRRMRDAFVTRVLALPPSVVERAGTGDLMTRSSGDVATVGTALRDAVPDVIVAVGELVVLLVAMFLVGPVIGLCALVGVPLLVLAARRYLRYAGPAYLAEGASLSRVAEELAVTAEGARTVEALGLGDARVRAADVAVGVSVAARMRTLALRCGLFTFCEISYSLPTAAILLVGGLSALHGGIGPTIGLGAVVAGSLYAWRLVEPIDTLLMRMEMLQSATASFARVVGVGQAANGTEAPVTVVPVDPARAGELRVDGVSHAYVAGRDVLHDVCLSVAAGERLALVGPSGAGKSTLGRLVAGVDRPRAGTITVGGRPVADLGPEERRRRVVMVTQEHHVFLGTLRDNLELAAAGAADGVLEAALAAVGARWAAGRLDTLLGAGGVELDAGQEQQIALARVVLADPDVVVLDEATSLLDPATARTAERSMFAVLAGRTVIAIAHRLHTAHDADRVAVMEDGRIVECAPHEELIAKNGPYARLWRTWHG